MPTKVEQQPNPDIYRINVKGRLAAHWSDWFNGMTIMYDPNRGETQLWGKVADQAALHGLLNKIRDLGLPLLSLIREKAEATDTTN